MPNTLFLKLEGPFQSWGERAQWSVRDTAPEPTKSGIVGLLGCALGLKTDDDLRLLSQSIRIGVRCDRPGQPLVDYHTITTGILSAEGKIKLGKTGVPETALSWRTYLCDAAFLVAIQSTPQWIDRLAAAVQVPVWPVYLGRKACVPSRPIYQRCGDFPTLKDALDEQEGDVQVRAVLEVAAGQGGVRRRDELDSNSRRTFRTRYTNETLVRICSVPEEE